MTRFNPSAVLFDLDGTLIDSAPDLGAAADKMRIDRGLASLPLEDYRPMAGAGARGMLGVALSVGPQAPEFTALRAEFLSNYEACMLTQTRAFDGVNQLLGMLMDRGLLWGVVTNKMARFTEPLTRSMSMFDRASAIISGDTTPHAKPHPAPLLEAASRMGVSPKTCIYVGDDERDIQAGRAAGMRTVAALYGYLGANSDALLWGADALIGHPAELLDLL